jgi:sarcosine oxidase subunit gamma
VAITALARRVHTNVRHRDPAAVGLPARPNTTAATADGLALWLGPDEWLVVGGDWSPAAGAAAERAWQAVADAATDVSAQWTGLRLAGPGAADLLSFACALDLHPAKFPPGSCAQTLLARVPAVLLHHPSGGYDLLLRPSHTTYLHAFLTDALDS